MAESTFVKKILDWIKSLSKSQIAVGASAAVLLVACIAGGIALSDAVGTAGKANGTESVETEVSESVLPELPFWEETEATEELEMTEVTEATEATEEIETIDVRIATTSIERDLKIKIVNQRGNLVKGFPFSVIITFQGVDKEYQDHDMDGIIHVKDIEGGEYKVHLQELDGILIKKNDITASVKAKIEYEKVEIENEIQDESQVNVSIEDTATNDVVVEAPIIDTVPVLESKVETTVVALDQVDMSQLPSAVVSTEKNEYVLEQTKVEIIQPDDNENSNDNEKPGNSETPGNSESPSDSQNPGNSENPGNGETPSDSENSDNSEQPGNSETPGNSEQPGNSETTDDSESSGNSEIPTNSETPGSSETPDDSQNPDNSESPSGSENIGNAESPSDTENTGNDESPSSTENLGNDKVPDDNGSGAETVDPPSGGSLSDDEGGYSVYSSGVTQTVSVATATVRIPKSVTLYAVGNEASVTANLLLEIEDKQSLIQSYSWKILDSSIAELNAAQNQTSAIVKAKKEGKTQVVVTFIYTSDVKGSTNTYELVCDVNVSKYADNETHLKDKTGNLLYADNQAQTIATPADLSAAVEFYSNPIYTGWQTIDGKLYYYTEEHVPAVGTQVIGGVKYSFQEDGTLRQNEESVGIDVSKWQGKIDWKAVADAGIDFAIIRCGYRGSSTGVIVEDVTFKANIQGATENGIKVGVYFFTQAITEAEAVEEASTAIALVSGYKLQFPIFIDTEEAVNGRANKLGKTERTAIVKAFCETVRNAGYKPGIYASKSWYNDMLNMSQLNSYNIWVAQYNTECNYSGAYDIWQYTDRGTVPGISEKVDMNICYTKY